MLYRPVDLDAQEDSVLRRIEELRQSVQYAVNSSPQRWQGSLRRQTFARAIRGSNSIEGYNVTLEDAIAAAEGQNPLEATEQSWINVIGYRQAMTYVLQLSDDPHFGYSMDLLRSLHYMMLNHDLSQNPGRWRPGPIYIRDDERREVVFEGPDAQRVPGLMQELVAYLNAKGAESSIIKAAMAHLNLVLIHPFSDGNGRMGRCLQTLVLARAGVLAAPFSSIEEYLGRNTRQYYEVLSHVGGGSWKPNRDARPWIRFCLTAHFRQANTLLRRMTHMKLLWDSLEIEILKSRLQERTILALADAASGLKVRNPTYRKAADISFTLASRDLKSLVDAGLLEAFGEKKGRFYLASPALNEITQKIPRVEQVEDPFVSQE